MNRTSIITVMATIHLAMMGGILLYGLIDYFIYEANLQHTNIIEQVASLAAL